MTFKVHDPIKTTVNIRIRDKKKSARGLITRKLYDIHRKFRWNLRKTPSCDQIFVL